MSLLRPLDVSRAVMQPPVLVTTRRSGLRRVSARTNERSAAQRHFSADASYLVSASSEMASYLLHHIFVRDRSPPLTAPDFPYNSCPARQRGRLSSPHSRAFFSRTRLPGPVGPAPQGAGLAIRWPAWHTTHGRESASLSTCEEVIPQFQASHALGPNSTRGLSYP